MSAPDPQTVTTADVLTALPEAQQRATLLASLAAYLATQLPAAAEREDLDQLALALPERSLADLSDDQLDLLNVVLTVVLSAQRREPEQWTGGDGDLDPLLVFRTLLDVNVMWVDRLIGVDAPPLSLGVPA